MLQSFDQMGALVLSLIHIPLAVGVTLHVLFNKRDVAASVGWIGLAWLSPIFGSILYLIFGINRVKRRANQLRDMHPFRPAAERSYAEPGRDDLRVELTVDDPLLRDLTDALGIAAQRDLIVGR